MGNASIKRVNFEDVQMRGALLISVLPNDDQSVLIDGTVRSGEEVAAVEDAIKRKIPIIVYGRHANDEAAQAKYAQLCTLGSTAYLYGGGLFEWLLMQEVYGTDLFPTSGSTLDHLKYKAPSLFSKRYLTN